MKLKRILKAGNGRTLRVGSHVTYCGDKCYIYDIRSNTNAVGLERCRDGISWLVEPGAFNAKFVLVNTKSKKAFDAALKICASMKKRIQEYEKNLVAQRDIKIESLAASIGMSFDDFCEQLEQMPEEWE